MDLLGRKEASLSAWTTMVNKDLLFALQEPRHARAAMVCIRLTYSGTSGPSQTVRVIVCIRFCIDRSTMRLTHAGAAARIRTLEFAC